MSSDNSKKRPFSDSMNRFSEAKALEQIHMTGRALPCSFISWVSEGIALVKFEISSTFTLQKIKAPIYGAQYVRYPIQAGEKGLLIPAAASIASISGQSAGTATLAQPANLSALTFLPIGNTEWQAVDHSVVTMYGPEGVTLRDSSSASTFLLTPESITIVTPSSFKATVGSTVLELTPAGWSLTGSSGSFSDGAASTSPEIMHTAWAQIVAWANTHTHPVSGSLANVTNTPYTGGSIAP